MCVSCGSGAVGWLRKFACRSTSSICRDAITYPPEGNFSLLGKCGHIFDQKRVLDEKEDLFSQAEVIKMITEVSNQFLYELSLRRNISLTLLFASLLENV